MYLWNIDKLAVDLKLGKKNKELTVFTALSPVVAFVMITLWAMLLLSHRFIADTFSYFISGADVYLGFYNFLGLCSAGAAATIISLSILHCKSLNKKIDGKRFLMRLGCSSTFVIAHLITYTLIGLFVVSLILLIILAKKTTLFSAEVTELLESSSISSSIKTALDATPLKEFVPESFYQEGLLSSLLSLPAKLTNLPEILQNLEILIRYCRGLLLGFYPLLIMIPVAMAAAYATIMTRFFKLIKNNG